MAKPDLKTYRDRMDRAVQALREEFSGLRTGRANAGLLDPVQVEAYGSTSPLNAVAAISVPEPRMISVNVWDKGMVVSVEKPKTVRQRMPSAGAACTVRFSACTPSRWPMARGSPRACAQRPLPSMIRATWRGPSDAGGDDWGSTGMTGAYPTAKRAVKPA